MKEYIFDTKQTSTWQKHLNQWRHDYDINIIKIVHLTEDKCTIYMTRTPKKEES